MSTSNGSANGAPLTPQTSYSASKSAMAAIFGPDHRYNKDEPKKASEVEPPSGIQGKGTTNEPYDQGNAPETVAGAGSAPEQSQEPPSGAQGKGTVDEPYDKGNAGESIAGNQPINTTTEAPPKSEPEPAPAPAAATTTTTAAVAATTNGDKQPAQQSDSTERGRTLAPPASSARQDRSVSPGTLDDGTHELCAGEKGESYEMPRGIGRLANKVFKSKN